MDKTKKISVDGCITHLYTIYKNKYGYFGKANQLVSKRKHHNEIYVYSQNETFGDNKCFAGVTPMQAYRFYLVFQRQHDFKCSDLYHRGIKFITKIPIQRMLDIILISRISCSTWIVDYLLNMNYPKTCTVNDLLFVLDEYKRAGYIHEVEFFKIYCGIMNVMAHQNPNIKEEPPLNLDYVLSWR